MIPFAPRFKLSQGPSGAPSWLRGRMGGRCMASWVLLAGLCMLPSAAGTCANFAAWLRTDKVVPGPINDCGGGTCSLTNGFFAVHVAPDAKSIVVTMQITSRPGSGGRLPTHAGIFGPALADQVIDLFISALLPIPRLHYRFVIIYHNALLCSNVNCDEACVKVFAVAL